jgi:dTDP-4-amino-4,6-dideoxygalactose transaminase
MNDISATIGLANFPHLAEIVAKHRDNADFYYDKLYGQSADIDLLNRETDRQSADWVCTILVEQRDDFMRMMKENGIEVSRVHDRNDKHQCLKDFKSILPNTDDICKRICCIPCGWWVTPENREYIVDCIKKGW